MDHGKPSLEVETPQAGADGVAPNVGALGAGPLGGERTDDQLIDAALAGHRDAFGELAERYRDRLYNALVRFTGSADDAHDLTQDALVQALVKLDRFRRDSAFFTWLYRIAFNRAVSVGRKRRERVSLDGLSDSGSVEPSSAAPRPEAQAMECERAELVHRALATLAEDYRQVLVLREFDGLDYQQISEVIETPVGTVRSRLFRARQQLKEALAPHLSDDAEPDPTS